MMDEPGMLPLLRDPSDDEEVHVRLDDGLVHRVHCDFHNLTACDLRLLIVNMTRTEVDAVWDRWVTLDDVTCLECLVENDKTYAQRFNDSQMGALGYVSKAMMRKSFGV